MEHPERAEGVVDRVTALGTEQAGDPATLGQRAVQPVGVGDQNQVLRIPRDHRVHGVDLFERRADRGVTGQAARDVHGPELAADPAPAQPDQVGVQLRLLDRDVDSGEVVADLAHRPGKVVVAIDHPERVPHSGHDIEHGAAGRDARRMRKWRRGRGWSCWSVRWPCCSPPAATTTPSPVCSRVPPTRTTEAPPPRMRFPPQKTNPELPVVGESIWVSGGRLSVTFRLAVHAVRRVDGRNGAGLVDHPDRSRRIRLRRRPARDRSRPVPGISERHQRHPAGSGDRRGVPTADPPVPTAVQPLPVLPAVGDPTGPADRRDPVAADRLSRAGLRRGVHRRQPGDGAAHRPCPGVRTRIGADRRVVHRSCSTRR